MSTPLSTPALPPGLCMIERGWLSANLLVCTRPGETAVIDTGYATHAAQTLALVQHSLAGRPLNHLINTHLHSDHCGGNAILQHHWPEALTWIPPGQAQAVRDWDTEALGYTTTGQLCPAFRHDRVLSPGQVLSFGQLDWQIHAAPGHDPHAVLLYQPQHQILVAGDALWSNGFGVVFPALDHPGLWPYEEVRQTLDLIEKLNPACVIPGHGPILVGPMVADALQRAHQRLNTFIAHPDRHSLYAAKALLKFKLIEWQQIRISDALSWAQHTPVMQTLHTLAVASTPERPDFTAWMHEIAKALARSGALRLDGVHWCNT